MSKYLSNRILPSGSKRIRTITEDNMSSLTPEYFDYIKKCDDVLLSRLESEVAEMQKYDPFLRIRRYAVNRLDRNSWFLFLQGKQRSGKTVFAYYFSKYVLGLNTYLIYSIEDLVEFFNLKTKHNAIIFPDLSLIEMSSRKYNTKFGKDTQELFNNLSIKHNLYIACYVQHTDALKEIRETFTDIGTIRLNQQTKVRTFSIISDDFYDNFVIPKVPTEEIDKLDTEGKNRYFDKICKRISSGYYK